MHRNDPFLILSFIDCLDITNNEGQSRLFIRPISSLYSVFTFTGLISPQHKGTNMTAREAVFPFGRQALYERNRYSPAIKSNGFLFVSGQVGSHEDGSPEHDLKAQVRLAFKNLNAVLAAAAARLRRG